MASGPCRTQLRSDWRHGALAFLAVLAAVLVCWGPGVGAFFAQDDFVLMEGASRAFQRASGPAAWLKAVFLHTGFLDDNYRPISTHVYFLVVQRLFGPSPLAFHVLALVFHLFVSIAIGALARRLGASRGAALLGALFYAARDALFGSVAWVAGIQDGLMTAFAVAAMWALAERARSERRVWGGMSLLLTAAALLSKEMAVVLPVLATTVVWALAEAGTAGGRLRRAWRLTWGHWALWAGFCVFRLLAIRLDFHQYPVGLGWQAAWRPGVYAFWTILGWDIWPRGLNWAFCLSALAGWVLVDATAALAALAAGKKGAGSRRLIAAGLAWWLAGVAFLTIQSERFHMYYLSLPAAGAALSLAGLFDRLCREDLAPRRRGLVIGLIGVSFVVLGARMNALKRGGEIPAGGFYQPANSRISKQIFDAINRAAPGLQGRQRVIFVDCLDCCVVGADVDGRGGRSVFPLDSMPRVMFNRPDLEVYHALTPRAARPPVKIDNVVDAQQFFKDGSSGQDLVLEYDKKSGQFSVCRGLPL